MKVPARSSWWRLPVSPLLCFGLAWLLAQADLVQRIEWRTLDWRTVVRAKMQPQPDSRITVLLFEDDTDTNLAGWPPDRAVHADLIKHLILAKPAVVTWDVIMDATRPGEGDAELARAAAMARRAGVTVITAAFSSPTPMETGAEAPRGPTQPLEHVEGDIDRLVGDAYPVLPFPQLRAESLFAFADTPPGGDGIRREIPLVVRVGREVYPTLSLQTLMAFFDVAPSAVRVRLGEAVYLPTKARGVVQLPISDDGRFLLNYRYDQTEAAADFRTFTYLDALVRLNYRYVEGKRVAAEMDRLAGGIVFVGQTVTGKADAGPSPRSPLAPLVLVHANLVNNVLAGDYARRAPVWTIWLGAVVLGYGTWLVGMRRPVAITVVLGVLVALLYTAAAFEAWAATSIWLPMTWPLAGYIALGLTVAGRRVIQEQRGREQVKQMFGTYLSPELLEKMLRTGQRIAVSSERRPVTVMFSDLRDFTRLAETTRDDVLIEQLNEYLAAMVECIHREGGTLHKFIGDAVMAVWGDLTSEGVERDATRAVRAALAMQENLARLNEKWRVEGKPPLRMGIGLNHGVVLIGNIGSPRRMEFTAIGDAVNLASRLESLNKELKTGILMGESVRALIGAAFAVRACGSLGVKGKAKPVEVFEILGVNPEEG